MLLVRKLNLRFCSIDFDSSEKRRKIGDYVNMYVRLLLITMIFILNTNFLSLNLKGDLIV